MVLDVGRKSFAGIVGVSTLAGDVDETVINDERSNERIRVGGFAVPIELPNSARLLLARCGS